MKESKIPKFRRCVLQNFPFIEEDFDALTDYELLCKVVQYLNLVIDEVNSLSDLKEQFAELKSYVDNYFDNLDVQEEINNKLEDMAEGGELASIIAQFLELAPVFGYNTISAMESATNLSVGSIARVLGNSSAAAGDGAFYLVREKVEGESADGVNKVAIGDSLIADRIPDKAINDINTEITNIDNEISVDSNILMNNAGVFLGTFFDNSTTKLRTVISKDGFNFTRILPNYDPTVRDPQINYIDGKFYIINTKNGSTGIDGNLLVSEDLMNWTSRDFSMGLTQYDQKWAPEIFIDPDTDKIYFTVTAGDSDTKKPYIAECTNIDNLTFTGLRELHSGGTAQVSIDVNISKKGSVYYMAWCEQGTAADDSATSVCKIASSTDLTNWTTINSNVFKELPFVEGIQIIPINDRFIIIGDATTSYHYYAYKECFDLANTNDYSSHLLNPTSLMFMRHGSIAYFSDKEILDKIATATQNENIFLNNTRFMDWPTGVNISGTITNLVVQPNVAYRITGNTTITNLLNPYKLDNVQFVFAGATDISISITNIQNVEGTINTRNRTLSNSSSINEKVIPLSLLGNCYWYNH